MKKFLIFALTIVMAGQPIFAQTITVKGRVTDAIRKKPLKGIKVMYKGCEEGVVTDSNGRFTVEGVNSNSVLMFSHERYVIQLVEISGSSIINVALERDRKYLDFSTDIAFFFCLHYGPSR
jgi:hypothetical protein